MKVRVILVRFVHTQVDAISSYKESSPLTASFSSWEKRGKHLYKEKFRQKEVQRVPPVFAVS